VLFRSQSNLYPRPFNMKLHSRSFQPLEPGKIRMLSFGLQARNITELGKHKVILSFHNERDGKEFKLKNVWVGKIEMDARTISTPDAPK